MEGYKIPRKQKFNVENLGTKHSDKNDPKRNTYIMYVTRRPLQSEKYEQPYPLRFYNRSNDGSIRTHVLVVRWLQELGRQRKIPLFVCFIDLQKAYDSVDRELLWEVLTRSGVPTKMQRSFRNFQDGMPARVRTNNDGEHSECFYLTQGLRQGWLCTITVVTVQRFVRCCATRRTSTLQPRRSHRMRFGPTQ